MYMYRFWRSNELIHGKRRRRRRRRRWRNNRWENSLSGAFIELVMCWQEDKTERWHEDGKTKTKYTKSRQAKQKKYLTDMVCCEKKKPDISNITILYCISLSLSSFVQKNKQTNRQTDRQWTSTDVKISIAICVRFTCSGVSLIHHGCRFPSVFGRVYWMSSMYEVVNHFHCCALSLRHWRRRRSKKGTKRFHGSVRTLSV